MRIDSATSTQLPTAQPSGWSIEVTKAVVGLPSRSPAAIIERASSMLSPSSWLNAPAPVLTSSTRLSGPSASFLHMMDAVWRGTARTVAVTSRSAYIFRSAGHMSADVLTIAAFTLRSVALKVSTSRLTVRPGTDSSLSSVPPVCPRPRPDIIGTIAPSEATIGARMRLVLSPTPPVLCLSTLGPARSERSSFAPLCTIARVSAAVSRAVIPLRHTAIMNAEHLRETLEDTHHEL